eukprot:gene19911-20419_t
MLPTAKFFINGEWVDPVTLRLIDVINPATEEAASTVAIGSAADVDRAVAAARAAFPGFAATSREERIALLKAIHAQLLARFDDLADAMTADMGVPATYARDYQAQSGVDHIATIIEVLQTFVFEELRGTTRISRDALVFAQCLEAAGVPAGVFNLVNGDGPGVGAAISAHPGVDMVSFTGSTRAGIAVAKSAADTVKRVAQELGGNSPNIILDDADLEVAVRQGVLAVMSNSGQSCDSPARMILPRARMREAAEVARTVAEGLKVGDPTDRTTDLGPVVSAAHFDKVQRLIEAGIAGGATLVTGGPGRPGGLNRGYYIRPTVFADVTETMPTFRNEVFGPVISLIAHDGDDDAVRLANDTEYGLAGRVQSGDLTRARAGARRIRAGWIEINGPAFDYHAPFGGYKQSGNGREYGEWGLHDYLEVKGMLGYGG